MLFLFCICIFVYGKKIEIIYLIIFINNFILEKLNTNYACTCNKLCKFLSNKIDHFDSLNLSYLSYFLKIPKYSILNTDKKFYTIFNTKLMD